MQVETASPGELPGAAALPFGFSSDALKMSMVAQASRLCGEI
jgi:hypothetical protein